MTADQIFDHVIALMFSETSDKADYRAGFLQILNEKLAECFLANQMLRKKEELPPLEAPPAITDLEEDVDYQWQMTRWVLPLGIAGVLYADDDETGISNVYREEYAAALERVSRAEFEEAESWQ